MTPTSPAPLLVLRSLAGVMQALSLRWYVFGAQAAIAYGQPRTTADIDVTIEAADADVPRIVGALRASGFSLSVDDFDNFVRETRVIPAVHHETGMAVDIILAGSELETAFLDRARVLDVGDLNVPVISPEDLVVTKVLAGRPKDLADAAAVMRAQAQTLDMEYVRRTLRVIEHALDRSDLLTQLDALGA